MQSLVLAGSVCLSFFLFLTVPPKKTVFLRSLDGNCELIPHPGKLQVLVVAAVGFLLIMQFIVPPLDLF